MKNFNLTLGIVEPLKIQPFEIVSQDINGNKLNINLVIDGSLIPYNLTGTTVILYFKRDDGVRLQQYATITNAIQGQIEIVLDTDIIATRGKVFAEVAVYVEEEMKCTSQLFGFQVRKNINDSETVVSGNDLPNYRQEMQRLETILDNLILSAGDSNPEIVAARYSMLENKTFTTLGDRLDFIEEKARQNVVNLETSITTVADDLAAHKAEKATQGLLGHIKLPETNKSITYQNGWAATIVSQYYKDEFGRVHIHGRAYGGTTTAGTILFTLPEGYRPPAVIYADGAVFGDVTDTVSIVLNIGTDGTVKFHTPAKYNIVFNFSFRV